MDYEIGKLSEDVKLTTTFKEYEAEEKDGDIILTAVLSKGDVPKLNRGYGIDGQQLWISLCNLYEDIKGMDTYEMVKPITKWCCEHVHPYYLEYAEIPEYKWDIESDAAYWDFLTNVLGDYEISVNRMKKDLEQLYRDTHLIIMFKKALENLNIKEELKQITWTGNYTDFDRLSPHEQLHKIHDFLSTFPKFPMQLTLDENGEFKVTPGFTSVFEAAYFSLSQYVSLPGDYPFDYGSRIGIGICACCGKMFIKNGNRQKYCDEDECKKERNRRKSKTAYRRKVQAIQDEDWA